MTKIVRSVRTQGVLTGGAILSLLVPVLTYGAEDPAPSAVKLNNPLKVDSLQDFFQAIISVVIILATPIIVFFVIYAGFLYVTARGNPDQITQANRALTYAIIGAVIILGAFAIATIVKNLVGSFTA